MLGRPVLGKIRIQACIEIRPSAAYSKCLIRWCGGKMRKQVVNGTGRT